MTCQNYFFSLSLTPLVESKKGSGEGPVKASCIESLTLILGLCHLGHSGVVGCSMVVTIVTIPGVVSQKFKVVDFDAMRNYLDRKRRTRVEEKEGSVAVSFKSGKGHYVVCTTIHPFMVKHNAKLSMRFYRTPTHCFIFPKTLSFPLPMIFKSK